MLTSLLFGQDTLNNAKINGFGGGLGLGFGKETASRFSILFFSKTDVFDFFNEMKKYSQELGKLAEVPYAECYWQHLGKGFQKNPIIQEVLDPYIVSV